MDESDRVNSANTRARKLNLEADLTLDQWITILRSYNYTCGWCGGQFEHLDHVIPLSAKTEGTTSSNVIPSCASCNRRKGTSTTYSIKPKQLKLFG